MPIWRLIWTTALPVEVWCAASPAVPAAMIVGSVSPTPAPPISQAGQDLAQVVGAGRERRGDPDVARRHQERSGCGHAPGGKLRGVPAQADRGDRHHHRAGRDPQARLQRRPAPALLQPEHQAEQLHAERDREDVIAMLAQVKSGSWNSFGSTTGASLRSERTTNHAA